MFLCANDMFDSGNFVLIDVLTKMNWNISPSKWRPFCRRDTAYEDRCQAWASCQIRKIASAHAPEMPETFSPSPQVSDPDMHHGTSITHVPWCMPGSLTSGFLWKIGGRGKRSRRMRNLQFYVSGKRPMVKHTVHYEEVLMWGPFLQYRISVWWNHYRPETPKIYQIHWDCKANIKRFTDDH